MDALVVVTLLNDGIPIRVAHTGCHGAEPCSGVMAVEIMFNRAWNQARAGARHKDIGRRVPLPRPLANRLSTPGWEMHLLSCTPDRQS